MPDPEKVGEHYADWNIGWLRFVEAVIEAAGPADTDPVLTVHDTPDGPVVEPVRGVRIA